MNITPLLRVAGDIHGGKIKLCCKSLALIDPTLEDLKQLSAILQECVKNADMRKEKLLKATERLASDRMWPDKTDC